MGNEYELRRVQRIGRASLSISLPKAWTDEHEISKGDMLRCEYEDDGSLRILPPLGRKTQRDKTVIINANMCEDSEMIQQLIVGNYILGRNRFVIKGKEELPHYIINGANSVVSKLIGLEIIEEEEMKIIIQVSIDVSQFSIPSLLKKLHNVTMTMVSGISDMLHKNYKKTLQTINRNELEVNRIYWLILRLLYQASRERGLANLLGLKYLSDVPEYRNASKLIELIGDFAKYAADSVSKILSSTENMNNDVCNMISDLTKRIVSAGNDAVSSLLMGDLILARKAISKSRKIIDLDEKMGNYMCHASQKIQSELIKTIWCMFQMASMVISVAEIAIDRYLASSSKYSSFHF